MRSWPNPCFILIGDVLFGMINYPIHLTTVKNMTLELSVKSHKEGRSREFDPSLRKHFIKSPSVHCVPEHVLKVG